LALNSNVESSPTEVKVVAKTIENFAAKKMDAVKRLLRGKILAQKKAKRTLLRKAEI